MRTETDIETLAGAVAKAAPDFDEESRRVALAVYRLLAQGSPVSPGRVAEHAGATLDRVEALLRTWPGVFLDPEGRVIGFWGLTIHRLTPTHRLVADGRELFAWCAWDTLFLPGVLDTTLAVESACPTTGETIRLTVSPAGVGSTSHPEAVVSFLVPDRGFDADIITSFCHYVHFFASPEAGEKWTNDRPSTFLLSLEDAFALGRRVNDLNFPSAFEAR